MHRYLLPKPRSRGGLLQDGGGEQPFARSIHSPWCPRRQPRARCLWPAQGGVKSTSSYVEPSPKMVAQAVRQRASSVHLLRWSWAITLLGADGAVQVDALTTLIWPPAAASATVDPGPR